MPSHLHPSRPGTPLRPRHALAILSALGCGLVLGRIVDILDYSQPLIYGAAAWLSACGVIRTETEADPVG